MNRHLFVPVLFAFTDGSDARVHVINVLQYCEFVNALGLSVTALLGAATAHGMAEYRGSTDTAALILNLWARGR